jgi:hypothetical protein
MKMILSAVITSLALVSFTTAAFPSDAEKPVVPAGPIYATVPGGEVRNDAEKAAKARELAETKDAEARSKSEINEEKAKADSNAVKTRTKANAKAVKDAVSTDGK